MSTENIVMIVIGCLLVAAVAFVQHAGFMHTPRVFFKPPPKADSKGSKTKSIRDRLL